MKLCDLVGQLLTNVPLHTDYFSKQVGIVSVSVAGTTVTIETDAPHGKSTGDTLFMNGLVAPLIVDTLTQVDGVATLVTVEDHDLTQDYPEHSTAIVSGADQTEYNGTFPNVTVLNRKTIQYPVDDAAVTPATGTIVMDDGGNRGFNGAVQITVTNTTTFTYELPVALAGIGPIEFSNAAVVTEARIGGSISIERFLDGLYTKQDTDTDAWAIVVLGDGTASNNRAIDNDAVDTQSPMTEYRQYVVEQFAIYITLPAKSELAAMDARDLIEDIKPAIFKSLLAYRVPSQLCIEQQYGVTFVQDGFFRYDKAYYTHELIFETVAQISREDALIVDDTKSFKDICLLSQNSFNQVIMSSDIDLDKEPL